MPGPSIQEPVESLDKSSPLVGRQVWMFYETTGSFFHLVDQGGVALERGKGQEGGEVVGGGAGVIAVKQISGGLQTLMKLSEVGKYALLHLFAQEIRE